MTKNLPIPVQPIEMSKDELTYWKGEIKSSLQRQKREFIDRVGYAELVRYFEAMQFEGNTTQLAIVDNFSPALLSVITSVYYQNPTVQVEAANPDADKPIKPSLIYLLQHPDFRPFTLVELMKGALPYAMTKAGMKEEMQVSCFDLLLAGYCGIEVNHTTQDEQMPQEDAPDDIVDGIMGNLKNMVGGVMDKLTGKGDKDEVEEEVVEGTQKDIRTDSSGQTYVKRFNPLDILFDPRAEVFNESRWVGKRIRMTLAEFNAKYPKFKGKVNASSYETTSLEYASHNSEENRKGVVLYELEIKKRGPRNCVLVVNNALDEPVDYYERTVVTNKFSLKYGCVDKYGKIYPMSRARKAKRPQDDINHYMTIQFEHLDRSQRKIAVYMNGLTESGKAAQRSSDTFAIVEKNTPQAIYEPMPAPQVLPENREVIGVMSDALNKAIGTTQLAQGGKSQNDTLGQDMLDNNAFQVNVNSVQDALQDVADQVVDGLKDLIQQTWDGEDYFKVTGIVGGDAWYEPSMGPLADVVLGDYSTRCNIASSMRPNPMKDRKDLMEVTQFVTSPLIVQFAQLHGKRPSMEPLNNLIKQFNMNPEMVFEDLQPVGVPVPPNTETSQIEGSPTNPQVAPIPVPQEAERVQV